MKVYDKQTGRFGNAIFRYLASSLFCVLYDAERTYSMETCDTVMTDAVFFEWAEKIVNNEECGVPYDRCYIFDGYFQHDKIYKKFKNKLVSWIENHPNDVLKTEGNVPFYRAIDIITNAPSVKTYDIVVHIRLEDFVICNSVIHPLSLKNILDQLDCTSFCFICNKISSEIEHQYIDFFKHYYDIRIESNDVLEDYTIMKNANITPFIEFTLRITPFIEFTKPSNDLPSIRYITLSLNEQIVPVLWNHSYRLRCVLDPSKWQKLFEIMYQ